MVKYIILNTYNKQGDLRLMNFKNSKLKLTALIATIAIPLTLSLYVPTMNTTDTTTQRYIVSYSNDQGKEQIAQVADQSTNDLHAFNHLNMVAVNLTNDQKNDLATQSGITSIEQNTTYTSAAQAFGGNIKTVNVKGNEQASWGYGTIDAQMASDSGYTGKGVKIAILDTGISAHSELNIAGGVSEVGYTQSYADDNGHGTFVAGVIGAQSNGKGLVGEAPDAQIYAVKILDSKGNGSTEDLAKGVDWAIQNHMDIVNMSIAFPEDSPAVEQVLASADQNGILLIAAAGNKGIASAATDTVQYPAKSSHVIAVAAIDDNLQRADFSSSGSDIELTAPGVDIVSTSSNGKYELRSGTSVAAPFVTGMAAILKQAYPGSTNAQIRQALNQGSIDLGAAGQDNLYGNGMISFQHLLGKASILASK